MLDSDDKSPTVNHRTIVGQRRSAKTRAKIIKAAVHIFAEKGPDVPVIDDFINAAGIARGTFYNYFDSTLDLLEATKEWLGKELHRAIAEVIADIEDPVTRLATGFRLWLRHVEQDRVWCGFVAKVRLEAPLGGDAALRDLQAAIKAKEVNVPSTEAALDLIEGTATRVMHRMLEGSVKKNYPNNSIMIILQGLGVAPEKIQAIMKKKLPPKLNVIDLHVD